MFLYFVDDQVIGDNMFYQLTINASVTLHRDLAAGNNILLETCSESIKNVSTATHQKKVDLIIVTKESVTNQSMIIDNTEDICIDATDLSFVTSQENVTLMKESGNERNVENNYTVLASVPFLYSDMVNQPPNCLTKGNNQRESDNIDTKEKNSNSLIYSPTFSSSSCVSKYERKTKQEFCIFCKSLKTHIYRHYQTVHKQEEEVQKFYFLPKGIFFYFNTISRKYLQQHKLLKFK